MAITKNTETSTGGEFTADKDYHGQTEDGRSFLKVAAGVTIPMAEAVELGVVKGKAKADATAAEDTKAEAAADNKSAAPAKNKGGEK